MSSWREPPAPPPEPRAGDRVPGLSGLVLCGGASRRMGSDKALLRLGGRPLVILVAERLAEVADPVFVASGSPGRLGALGYPEVADESPDAGPLAGLAAGLAASPHRIVAAVAVDMPFASRAVVRLLAERWRGEDAVVPVTDHGPQPLHALYATSALRPVREAIRERRLAVRELLSRLTWSEVPEREWRIADPTGRFALNLNRPEDLEVFVRRGSAPQL